MSEQSPYAGLLPRFFALAADYLVFVALFFPVTRLVKGVWLMGAGDHRWRGTAFVTDPLCLGFLAFMLAYFSIFEGLAGATPGKRLLGLRVEAAGGVRPGLGRALARNLLRLVDGLPALNIVGVATILSSPERARVGDRLAGTRVVQVRR